MNEVRIRSSGLGDHKYAKQFKTSIAQSKARMAEVSLAKLNSSANGEREFYGRDRIPTWLDEPDIQALERLHGIELAPKTGAPRAITGHIDFLQVRNGAVHILDYKPDARTNKPIAQLAIYALALTRLVPGLKLFDIKCAWFNEQEYCEFFPRTLLARHK